VYRRNILPFSFCTEGGCGVFLQNVSTYHAVSQLDYWNWGVRRIYAVKLGNFMPVVQIATLCPEIYE
jgi:hypothetical protein